MSAEQPFVSGDWTGRGFLYEDVPVHVQRQCQLALQVPDEFLTLVPLPQLPVSTLCALPLPRVTSTIPSASALSQLFTLDAATQPDYSAALSIVLWPEDSMRAVANLLPQAWLDGRSVQFPGTAAVLPLWIVNFWVMLGPGALARQRWLAAGTWLGSLGDRAHAGDTWMDGCLSRLRGFLDVTPWTLQFPSLDRDANIDILPAILKDSTLNQDAINLMIGVIQQRLSLDPLHAQTTVIWNLHQVSHMLKLSGSSYVNSFATAYKFRNLRSLGTQLKSCEVIEILMPYHLPASGHWAACRIQRSHGNSVTLAFGDSLGLKPPADLCTALTNWMELVGLRVTESPDLPHGLQNDTISCGIACINTIEHAVFGVPRFRALRRDTFRLSKVLEVLAFVHENSLSSELPHELWPSQDPSTQPGSPPFSTLPEPVTSPVSASTSSDASTSAVTSKPLQDMTSIKQGRIAFRVLTPEEKAQRERERQASLAERLEHLEEEREAAAAAEEEKRVGKLQRQRELTKNRVRRLRAARVAAEVVSGERDSNGKKKRVAKDQIVEPVHDVPEEILTPNPAAHARPSSLFSASQGSPASSHHDVPSIPPPTVLPSLPVLPLHAPQAPQVPPPSTPTLAASPAVPLPATSLTATVSGPSKSEPTLAQLSRPYRMFKTLPKDKKAVGRPRVHQAEDAQRVNWQNALLWPIIQIAAERAGPDMKPKKIVEEARLLDKRFEGLARQTLGDWIERPTDGSLPRWKTTVLARAALYHQVGGQKTRVGILAAQPELAAKLSKTFKQLRGAGVPLTIHSVHAITQGMIAHFARGLVDLDIGRGKKFACSLAWCRRVVLHNVLGFSQRRPTRAAQKVPDNAPKLGDDLFWRLAYNMDEEDIPPHLVVNSDQTQSPYAYGSDTTWAETGAKQVSVVGQEEKRAFTLNVGVSMSGTLLPFQAIFQGHTGKSLPSPDARGQEEAKRLNFRFEASKTKTYWATQDTMKSYVVNILVPYYKGQRALLGLPDDQYCIWLIDLWAVHRSEEFRQWMKQNYPWIIILYVPANCTSLYQPCDVGIQRVLKHALKRASHVDMVTETVDKLDAGVEPEKLKLDVRVGPLRDRSVQWMLRAFKACEDPELVKKAWHNVVIGEKRLTPEFLTSRDTRRALRNLRQSNPALWSELSKSHTPTGSEPDPCAADVLDGGPDDMAVPTAQLVNSILGRDQTDGEWTCDEDGHLQVAGPAESDDPGVVFAASEDEGAADEGGVEETERASTDEGEQAGSNKGMDVDMTDTPVAAAPEASGSLKEIPRARRPQRARLPQGWYAQFMDEL